MGWGCCAALNLLPFPEMVFKGMILSPGIAFAALMSLIVTGILSGIYPAYMAAQMNPIDALRFEVN